MGRQCMQKLLGRPKVTAKIECGQELPKLTSFKLFQVFCPFEYHAETIHITGCIKSGQK